MNGPSQCERALLRGSEQKFSEILANGVDQKKDSETGFNSPISQIFIMKDILQALKCFIKVIIMVRGDAFVCVSLEEKKMENWIPQKVW